jgi:TRAP-type C4-dicarboxylate transport system substrate-binding protein
MHRVATLALIAALLLGNTATSAAELKLATVAPEGSSWMKELRAAGKEVSDRTAGRVVLKFYGGGIQGNDKKVLRKIRIGQLQGGVFTANGLAERYKDLNLYGVPLLFDSQAEVDHVRKQLDATLVAGLDSAGFVSYGFAGGGFAYLMANRPVARLEDLRGQKVWLPEGDEVTYEAMKALQVSPVVLPLTDVLTGLETGLLDIVATPPVGAVVLQWYTKVKFITQQPLSYTMGLLAIDKKALGTVSAADQAVLKDVMTRLYVRLDQQNRVDNTKAEQALRANGLKFVMPDAAEVPRWRSAVQAANQQLAAKGIVSAELLARAQKLITESRAAPRPAVAGATR